MDKEINTNKYFVELTDIGGGTIGYTVLFPEELLREIIKQNKQLKRKEQECEELENKMAAVIYAATGGRLSYSNYTLDAIEQAFNDQLEILSDRKVKEETTEIKTKYQKYKEALNEIDKEIHSFGSLITIQNIITKAKGEENE